jgi:hypothetical protein
MRSIDVGRCVSAGHTPSASAALASELRCRNEKFLSYRFSATTLLG